MLITVSANSLLSLLVVAVVCAALLGCETAEDRKAAEDEERRRDPTPDLLVSKAAVFFERTVIIVRTNCVESGFYRFEEVVDWQGCAVVPTIRSVLDAVFGSKVAELRTMPSARSDLSRATPRGPQPTWSGGQPMTAWEALEKRNQTWASEKRKRVELDKLDDSILLETTIRSLRPNSPLAFADTPELDLSPEDHAKLRRAASRFAIYAEPLNLNRRHGQFESINHPMAWESVNRDSMAAAAKQQAAELAKWMASTTYSAEEIRDLILTAPDLFFDTPDSEIHVHSAFRAFFDSVVREETARFSRIFGVDKRVEAKYTWEDFSPLSGYIFHGKVYHARQRPGKIYISPMLARAAFFMCFNSGVDRFIAMKYRDLLTSHERRHPDDYVYINDLYRSFDVEYRECARDQAGFIVAHELAHEYLPQFAIVSPNNDLANLEEELVADCIAYQIHKPQTDRFNLFRDVVWRNDVPPIRALRIENLKMIASFSSDDRLVANALGRCQANVLRLRPTTATVLDAWKLGDGQSAENKAH